MPNRLIKEKIKLKNLFMLTIAGLINAFGITVFLTPVKLYDSGISGTAMLCSQITPEWLSLSFFLIVLNVPLFLFGLKRQGVTFTVYSLYTVCIYSIGAWLVTDVSPIEVNLGSPLAGNDLLLCALFGGLISGIGSGTTIRYGGAIDGIEVMAVIFAKKLNITVGTFVMVYNVLLYIISGFILNNWVLPLYSIVTYGAGLKTIDFIVEGLDRNKAVMIITDMPDEVGDILSQTFESGYTVLPAIGGYSGHEKTAIYFVLNRFEIARMKDVVHEIDPHAYMTITEVADVFKNS